MGSLKGPLVYCKARGRLRPEGGVGGGWAEKGASALHPHQLGTCPQARGAAPPAGLAGVPLESGPWWGSASSKGACHSAVIAGESLSPNFMTTANGIP